MSTGIGLIVVGLLICCVHAEQAALQEQLTLGSDDLPTQVKSLQQNVTELWTYIYRLRQAVEVHLTDLTRRQSRVERTIQHFGGHDSHGHGHDAGDHSHSESGHHHEPLTSSSDHHDDHSSSDHHHDDHGSSDHHHDDHGTSDHHHDDHGSSDHHHDDHGSSDHRHDDHGSSDHHHDDHGSSDQHHDDHHHDSHGDGGDHHHTDDHHSDYHDDHHHGHHSSSESHSHSHTDDHSSHNDSDHSKEDDRHHHHHGDDSRSAEDQQATQDIEKPFTVTVVRSHHRDHHVGAQDRTAAAQNLSDPLNLLGGHSHHHHHHHHHSHQDQSPQAYDSKVTIPKFSDYRQYTFATCDVQPNRVISAELQQEVNGQVSFWQKKTGGPLNIHVRLRGFAIGDHHGHQQQQEQTNEAPVHGAGHRHGFHVHEFADLSAGCQSTGPHYNPLGFNHGGPKSSERHVGDLGNIECDDHGVTNIVFADPVASLTGTHSIVGRALVIHSDVDDYGVNKDDPESLITGNAGTRIACCIIRNAQKLPLATYKSIKLAATHQP